MKLAIPTWHGRVSPVLDVARSIVLFELRDGAISGREERLLSQGEGVARARELAAMGVDTVICAAVSRSLLISIRSFGLTVIDQTCGSVDAVAAAFVGGDLIDKSFLLPGCGRGRGRRARRGRGARERGLGGSPSCFGKRT